MARVACLTLWLSLAASAGAQSPADMAQAAVAQINAATAQLREARSGRDRVRALTATVQGYEKGLAALRQGLRRASQQEARLSADLAAQEAEVGQLLGVLQSVSRVPAPVGLVHPAGPTGTARAGMLLSDVTPGLQARVDALRSQLADITALQDLQKDAIEVLGEGLNGAREARTALSQAIADRTDLPRKFIEDPIQTAVIIASTETLDSFASALGIIEDLPDGPVLGNIDALRGELPLPVAGEVLRRAGQADAAGVTRPGLLVATGAEALVTTPVPATIRYLGPLLDFGLVAILEPQDGTLFVFAGMAQVLGEMGQVLPAGDPVGLMGASSQSSEGGGNTRPETLYIEVRENTRIVDPETWFRTGRE